MSIRKIQVEDGFQKCPNCGYEQGFHTSFQKEHKEYNIILICPGCGTHYDIGWKTTLENV